MVLELDAKALQDTEGKQKKQKQCLHMSWGSVAIVRHVGNYEKKLLTHRFCAGLELHLEKLQKMKEHVPFLVDHRADGWAGSRRAEGPDLSN